MTVYFKSVHDILVQRISRLDCAFDRHFLSIEGKKNIDKFAFQEGLISAMWQSWGAFCKDLLFGSIRGGETIHGQHITHPQYSTLTDYELFYIANVLSCNQNVTQIKSAKPQGEATWGDVGKLGHIFTSLNTPNAQNISVAVASSVLIKDLQTVRNANAHITPHTISTINAAKVRYSNTKYRHPSDVIFWVEPQSNQFLWKSWVDEIQLISSAMIV